MAVLCCRQSLTVLLSITISLAPAWESTTISRMLRSLRPSPPLWRSRASVSLRTMLRSRRTWSVWRARLSRVRRSSLERLLRTKTWQRDSRGVMTSKEGFSVVAPIRTMSPRSTAPRRASCWALLKRWISSMKSTGAEAWEKRDLLRAWSMTSRTSLTPALTAESVKNSRSMESAIMRARVVLPTPGGPQRIKEERMPLLIILCSTHPGPTRCFCPTYSSREWGRILSGRGGSICEEALIYG